MVGLNAPRPTPRGHAAVDDAINLLASFGGGSDDLHRLLEDNGDPDYVMEDIAKKFGVSRATVYRAINRLSDDQDGIKM